MKDILRPILELLVVLPVLLCKKIEKTLILK